MKKDEKRIAFSDLERSTDKEIFWQEMIVNEQPFFNTNEMPEEEKRATEFKQGWAVLFRHDNELWVPIIEARVKGQGMGTEIVMMLEQIAKTHQFSKVVYPNVISNVLMNLLLKNGYKYSEINVHTPVGDDVIDIFSKEMKE